MFEIIRKRESSQWSGSQPMRTNRTCAQRITANHFTTNTHNASLVGMNITGEDVGVGRLMELEIIGLGYEVTTTRYSEPTPEEVKSNNKRYDDEHGVNI